MVVTASSMIGRIFARGMRARARIESVWMVADAMRASLRGSAFSGKFAHRAGVGEHAPECAIGSVDRIGDETVKVGVGDRLRGGAEHREAAARTVRAGEVKIKRGSENAPQLDPQRLARRKQGRERLIHALSVLPVSLQIERALVAEGAVKARPVQAGRRADVVQRGGGEAVAPKNIHRLRQRGLRLEGARPATPARARPWERVKKFFVPC